MALNLGPLNVLLRLQGADKFKRETRQATSGVAKLGKAIGGLVAIQQVTQQFVQATQVFAEFERGMVRVGAVTNSLGSTAFAGLTDRAQDLAKTTEFTARQVADAMGFMGMAGMKTNQIFDATPAVLQLASAGMVDVASAADTVTNIMAGYGLKTEDLNNANNVLVATFTNSNTSLQQLGQSFKYVGPVAKSAGVRFKEAAAVIGLMGNAGIQADMAGTALRGTIIKLLDPTAEGAKIMRQYGINVTDTNGKLKPMVEIFKQLEPIADDSAKMIELFGLRAGPGMQAALTQGTGALEKLIKKIDGAGNIAERIAKAQMETLDGKIKIMKSNFEGLQIAIGDALGSKTAKLVGFLANRFDDLAWSIKKVNKALSDPTAQAAQSEAEVRRQQNAMRQREIGRMLGTGFYRASYPMGHPLAGMQVSPTMLQAQGATAGMMAGTEPGRLAAITDKQRAILQEELNRLRAEEAKLIKEENIERDKKKKKDEDDDGGDKKKKPKIFDFDAERAAYLRQIAPTDFDAAAEGITAALAKIGYAPAVSQRMGTAAPGAAGFGGPMTALSKTTTDLAKKQAEAAEKAAALGHRAELTSAAFERAALNVIDTVSTFARSFTGGTMGATFGPQIASALGGALGAMFGSPQIGSAIGGAIGEVFGPLFDVVANAVEVFKPLIDVFNRFAVGLILPMVVGMAPGMASLARVLEKIVPLFEIIGTGLGFLDFAFSNFRIAIENLITAIGNVMTGNIEGAFTTGMQDFMSAEEYLERLEEERAKILAELNGETNTTADRFRELNEELTNVPTGIKRLRAFQFGATQGSGRGTPFGQSAFGV